MCHLVLYFTVVPIHELKKAMIEARDLSGVASGKSCSDEHDVFHNGTTASIGFL